MPSWYSTINPPDSLCKTAELDDSAASLAASLVANVAATKISGRPWLIGLPAAIIGGEVGYRGYREAKRMLRSERARKAYERELRKISEAKGHWRELSPNQQGHDQQGNPISGKTWVNYGLREGVQLKEHQQDFSDRVSREPGKGYIAAHGTGTGKTVSAVGVMERLIEEKKARRALVVAPAGIRKNFADGVAKFSHSKAEIISRPTDEVAPDTNYVVVSYEAFRRDPEAFIDAYAPDVLIADEFHRAVNDSSITSKAIEYARSRIPIAIGLTASIAQNEPADVAPLVNLISGGTAPVKSKKEFNKRYVKRVPTGQRGVFGGQVRERKIVKPGRLYNEIGPHIHYIEDLNATEKPPKEVRDVAVPMSKEQVKIYNMAMRGVDPTIQRKISLGMVLSKQETMNVFTRLMRARQISNSIHIANQDLPLEAAAERTPKIKKIMDDVQTHLDETPDGKVIVYTNLVRGGVDVISAGLKARGIDHGIFAGKSMQGMTESRRQQDVEDYQAGEKRVIIITGAGAEGLSLGNTTMVALADGHYNPERMNQAMARGIRAGGQAHRPQAERKVIVNRYVSSIPKSFWQRMTFQDQHKKSVDQWVYTTADRKERGTRQLRDVLQQRHEHEQKKQRSRIYRWFGGGP
jgi:ERCC4-related helicase